MTGASNNASPDATVTMRDEIDRIVQSLHTPDEQAAALEEIRPTHPHSIRLIELETIGELSKGDAPDYDCFAFALDLIDCPERIAVRQYAPRNIGPIKRPGVGDVLPGPSFVQFLLLPELASLQSCGDHDIVLYYDRFGNVKHAGKVIAEDIVSKWGMKGSLWQHALWEVPSSYGRLVRFYSHRPKDFVRKRWLAYLRRLAQRVSGFTSLVSVMVENDGKNLNAEELLRLATDRTTP